jgi:hypothetical protein
VNPAEPGYYEDDSGEDAPGYGHDRPEPGAVQLVCCGRYEWHYPEGMVCCRRYVLPEPTP